MDSIELTRLLVNIPSVSGDEAEVCQFLASYLQSLGYTVELQEVTDGRSNIIAMTEMCPRVVLSTHMDTVPPFIPLSEDEEYLYGRGACDAKGIIAAQISAAERLRSDGFAEVGLLLTVDEERGSEGARAANAHRLAPGCRYLINGEPTDNKLAVGSKGSLRLRIRTEGRAAHSAYPEAGDSAIEKLLDVLADIRACPWPSDPLLGETTCNIGTIAGGTSLNIIPAEAGADLQLRLVTKAAPIREMLEGAVAGRARVEYLSVAEPVRMRSVEGFEHGVVRFTTDIPYLTNWGTPLLCGPGSILDAHTSEERISKRELKRAVNLYVHLIRSLLTREDNGDDDSPTERKETV